MDNRKKKRRFGVLDFFIILVLLLCILGIAMRFVFKLNTPEDESFVAVETEEYYVSYISRNQRNMVPDYLTEDAEFRFLATNATFGYPFGKATVQPAEKRYTGSDGVQYVVPNTSNDDRTDRNDLFGTFIVKGKLNGDGVLKIDGSNNVIALNKEYSVRSDLLVFKFVVTGITKAS